MFETLSDRLTQVFSALRGRGRLSPADIDATCREIRIALLEADVALPVVRQFIARVKERAGGEEVSGALNPAQQVIKIVNEELIGILGGEERRLRFAKTPPTVILLAGLQGSGKTTLAAKLGLWLKEQGNTPMLVAADLQRPNAVQQLQVVGERAGVPVYAPQPGNGVGDPVAVARDSLEEARRRQQNMVIIDTAGRLGVDAEMMAQAVAIRDATQPDEILFVVDAMIGQDAVATAQAFLDGVGYDGVVLTKLDGDARGGAALSIVQLTGRPIMFASSGEKLEDFDLFHPDRMASRILDLGDILTLIEQAEKNFDAEQTANLAGARLRRGLHARGLRRAAVHGAQARADRQPARHAARRGQVPGADRAGQRQGPGPGRGHRPVHDAGRTAQPEDHQRLAPGAHRQGFRRRHRRGLPAGHELLRGPEADEGHVQRRHPRHAGHARHAGHGRRGPPGEQVGAQEDQEEGAAQRRPAPGRRARARRPSAGTEQPDQDAKTPNGPGQGPAGLPNLGGGLPEGFSENLAEQLSKMPSGLNFPPPPGPQGNIPAAFRGGGKRKKK